MPEILVKPSPKYKKAQHRGRWISIDGHDAESFGRRCLMEFGCDVGTEFRYEPSPDIPRGLVFKTRINPMLWMWLKHRQSFRPSVPSYQLEVRRSNTPDRRTFDNSGLFRESYFRARDNLYYLVMQLAKKRIRRERGSQGDAYWIRIPADERPEKVEGYTWTALVEEHHVCRVHLDELGDFTRTEAILLAEYLVSDYPELGMEIDRTEQSDNNVVLNVYLPVVTHVLRPAKSSDIADECESLESD